MGRDRRARRRLSKTDNAFSQDVSYYKAMKKENPALPAVTMHQDMDRYVEESRGQVSCSRGCAFCCWIHVKISHSEAVLLAPRVFALPDPDAAIQKLLRQSQAHDEESWKKLDKGDKSCIFLKEDNTCFVYDDRPMMCRIHHSVSPPENCDAENNPGQKIGIPRIEKGRMLIIVMDLADQMKTMPKVLLEVLNSAAMKLFKKSRNSENERSTYPAEPGTSEGI